MPGILDHAIEGILDVFPESIAIRLDHHAALYRRIVGQLGIDHCICIPAGFVHTRASLLCV